MSVLQDGTAGAAFYYRANLDAILKVHRRLLSSKPTRQVIKLFIDVPRCGINRCSKTCLMPHVKHYYHILHIKPVKAHHHKHTFVACLASAAYNCQHAALYLAQKPISGSSSGATISKREINTVGMTRVGLLVMMINFTFLVEPIFSILLRVTVRVIGYCNFTGVLRKVAFSCNRTRLCTFCTVFVALATSMGNLRFVRFICTNRNRFTAVHVKFRNHAA